MRKMIAFCLMAFCTFFDVGAFANETLPLAGQCIDKKLYVEPGTVHVAPTGIFLNLEGNFVPVDAVCIDEHGVYVLGYNAVKMVKCHQCDNYYDADNQSSQCRNGYHPWKCQHLS